MSKRDVWDPLIPVLLGLGLGGLIWGLATGMLYQLGPGYLDVVFLLAGLTFAAEGILIVRRERRLEREWWKASGTKQQA